MAKSLLLHFLSRDATAAELRVLKGHCKGEGCGHWGAGVGQTHWEVEQTVSFVLIHYAL